MDERRREVCIHGYFENRCRHCAAERGEEPPKKSIRRPTLVYQNWRTGRLEPDCEPYPGDD
jgi:hypothetical protein